MRTYQRFSSVLDDSAERMSERELSDALDAELAGLDVLDRISFDKAAKTIQSSAQTALPGVAQGAALGAAAGPWGALIGALAGGATSLAAGSARKPTPAPVAQSAMPAVAPAAPVLVSTADVGTGASAPPAAAVTATGPSGTGNPAAQLLWVIQNPQMMQALASLVAGSVGRRQIPVGQTSAPPGAFLNLLTSLATHASMQADAIAETTDDSYLRHDGGYTVDVGSPNARANALLEHLRRASAQSSLERSSAMDWLVSSGIGRTQNIQFRE